jgi:hypothetical protein
MVLRPAHSDSGDGMTRKIWGDPIGLSALDPAKLNGVDALAPRLENFHVHNDFCILPV